MKVKIISCDDDTFWYHKHIGCEFEVIQAEFNADLYLATAISRQIGNGIFKKDCEVVEEDVHNTNPSTITINGAEYNLVPKEEYVKKIYTMGSGVSDDNAFDGDTFIHIGDEVRKLTREEKSILFPHLYMDFISNFNNKTELKTFEDCFRVIRPRYYINNINTISRMNGGYSNEGTMDHNLFPSKVIGAQIQAAIKLFVIHAALVPNWKYDPLGTHWKVAYYVGPGKQKLATYCDKHGVATQFMFPTEELAKKAIDIGGDLWMTYYGMK